MNNAQKITMSLVLKSAFTALKTEGKVQNMELRLGQVHVSIESIETSRDVSNENSEFSFDVSGLTSRKYPDSLKPLIKVAGDFAGSLKVKGLRIRGHVDLDMTISYMEFSSAVEALDFVCELGANAEVI